MHDVGQAGALGELSGFRQRFYGCLAGRADVLFELTDAVLCSDGPVTSLAELSLTAEHRRGHGALYDAVNHGHLEVDRLRVALAGLPVPRAADGRIVLAVDVSPWLRPDAACSPDRLFCHVYGRSRSASQFIPGWPYSFVAALETGRTSWTAILDAVRLEPVDDATAVTAAQLEPVKWFVYRTLGGSVEVGVEAVGEVQGECAEGLFPALDGGAFDQACGGVALVGG